MLAKKPKKYEIGEATDAGRRRRGSPNQDSLVTLMPRKDDGRMPIILAVADGMGGYVGGAFASQAIVQRFRSEYKLVKTKFEFEPFTRRCVDLALEDMCRRSQKDSEYESMGSTLVAAALHNGSIALANVGDSRAYLCHNGRMTQLSFDHSFVGEAMRAGLLTAAEAMVHPKKNRLTQSISLQREDIKIFFADYALCAHDVLLLCSDGLWGVVSEAVMQAVISELPPQAAADKLVKLANAAGGPDNISVIVLRQAGANPPPPFPGQEEDTEKTKP